MPNSRGWRWKTSPLAAIACALLCSLRAVADEKLRIVVVRTEAETTTLRRLEAELRSLDLVVVPAELTGGGESRLRLEQLARSQHAIAAVHLVAHGAKVEVWIADRVTNKTVFRELTSEASARDATDDSIAVGVAELLRATLMEVNAPPKPKGDFAATPELRALAYPSLQAPPPEPIRLRLSLSLGGEAGLRGIGLSAFGGGSLGWLADSGLGLELLGGATLLPAVVQQPSAKASLAAQWLGVGALFGWPRRASFVEGRAGVGAFGTRIEATGEDATLPYVARRDVQAALGLYAHGGVVLGSASLRLLLDVGAQLLPYAPAVRFDAERVGVWGQPALLGSLGAEWRPAP
ncbi:MAG: hypothetical protein QM756_39980 [Polyangiaceae bacterium]